MTNGEARFLQKSSQAARALLDLQGALEQINVLWAGTPDYDTTITQTDIDKNSELAGLTTQQLADAEFAMATILASVRNALPALTVMASLY